MQPVPAGQRRERRAEAGALPLHPWLSGFHSAGFDAWLRNWRTGFGQALELEAERRRPFLWLPVAMGVGILLYFAADREPALWAPLSGFVLSAILAVLLRTRRLASMACLAVAAALAGYTAAAARIEPVEQRRAGAANVQEAGR